MKRLKVVVTDAEIDGAVQGNSQKCMIAEAIRRDYRDRFTNIVVDKEEMAMTERETKARYKFLLPPVARVALLVFDHGKRPVPFTVYFRRPIVRQRRSHLTSGDIKKGARIPRLAGNQSVKLARGAMPRLDAEGRLKMGRDRYFGKRVFAAEFATFCQHMGVPVPA